MNFPTDSRRFLPGIRFWKIAALVLVSTLILAEIALRFFLGNMNIAPYDAFPNDGRCMGLTPGESVEYTGWWLKLSPVIHDANDMGFRGKARPKEKTPDVFRVLVLGDSNVYGQGVAADKTLPAQMEELLNARLDKPVEVLNFGIPGFNAEDVVMQYEHFASAWEHDLLVYVMAGNDLGSSMCQWLEKPLIAWMVGNVYTFRVLYGMFPGQEAEGQGTAELSERLRTTLTTLRDASTSQGRRVAVLLLDEGMERRRSPVAPSETCDELDIANLNVRDRLIPNEHGERRLARIPNEGHLAPEGYAIVARHFADWLSEESLLPD